jgi:hypothetical protein
MTEEIRETILTEAAEATSGDRQRDYGHPAENHHTTAEMWQAYLRRKYSVLVGFTSRDICMMNILQKISRDANAPKRDNLVDIAGYARNCEMIEGYISNGGPE